jgi:hypothetical protein
VSITWRLGKEKTDANLIEEYGSRGLKDQKDGFERKVPFHEGSFQERGGILKSNCHEAHDHRDHLDDGDSNDNVQDRLVPHIWPERKPKPRRQTSGQAVHDNLAHDIHR